VTFFLAKCDYFIIMIAIIMISMMGLIIILYLFILLDFTT